MAVTQVLSPLPRFDDGCREMKYRRQELQTVSGYSKNFKRSRNSQKRFRRDPFHIAVILSVTTLMLSCSTIKEAPMLVNAFVQHTSCRPYSVQRNRIAQKHNHIRQLPSLPYRQPYPLSAKTDGDDEEEIPSFNFFQRKDNEEEPKTDKDDEAKPKDIPFVGRFFATEEEKEEKRRMKKAETEAKERLKLRAKKEKEQLKLAAKRERLRLEKERSKDSKPEEEDSESVVTGVKNYFRERQIRKDAETLRFQVRRKEELRQIQLEKDAEELRLAVQQREQERREKLLKLKVPTAPIVAATSETPAEDIVRKKIQSQKELDQARKDRLEEIRETRKQNAIQKQQQQQSAKIEEKKTEVKSESSGSKSQRLGGVVSAAQKFVSGVFDGKEQWIVVAPKTRISPGEILPVTAAGIDLLLVASKDGSAVHCVANSCPHLGTPLEVGSLARLPIESKNAPTQQQVQPKEKKDTSSFGESDIANMLKQDGCEDCIVCPLHKTAFALKSGEVRGEWCPYPPVIGKLTGAIKTQANLPVFDVRTKGKNIEVRLNTPVEINDASSANNENKKR